MDGLAQTRYVLTLAAVMMLTGLAGCGGGSSSPPDPGAGPSASNTSPEPQGIELSTAAASPTKVVMSWRGGTQQGDTLQVYRNGVLDSSASSGGAGAADMGLTPGTQYCYQLMAAGAAGAGTASSNKSCVSTIPLAGWDIQMLIQAPPLSLALDAQGMERVSFCSSEGVIYAARQTGGAWVSTIVDPGVTCFAAQLAIGGDGAAHILYVDGRSNQLKYATGTAGNWSIATVDGADGAEFYTLALDNGGHAHVAYLLFTGAAPDCYQIVYASDASGSWQSAVVAHELAYPAIAVDGAGTPHIAYVSGQASGGSYPVHYLTATSSGWSDAIVAASDDPKSLVALAADAAGHGHLVYKSGLTLEYASDAAGAWQSTQVDAFNAAGSEANLYGVYDVSIDLDAASQPHLSYEDTDGNLKYAALNQGAWHSLYIDTEGRQDQIRMDAAGHAHIMYGNTDNLYSKLAVSP